MVEQLNVRDWAQRQRLCFIERQLMWERGVTTTMLCDQFNITRAIASKDLNRYLEFAPENVLPYSAKDKRYRPSPTFRPVLIEDGAKSQSDIVSFEPVRNPNIESVPQFQRRDVDNILSVVLAAIDTKASLNCRYRSMDHPEGQSRQISPHAIVTTGTRVHIRAFCWLTREFRDFVPTRFVKSPTLSIQRKIVIALDEDWETRYPVKLVPNPSLSAIEQQVILSDYDTPEDPVSVRGAVLPYFLRDNALPATQEQAMRASNRPREFPVLAIHAETQEDMVGYTRF